MKRVFALVMAVALTCSIAVASFAYRPYEQAEEITKMIEEKVKRDSYKEKMPQNDIHDANLARLKKQSDKKTTPKKAEKESYLEKMEKLFNDTFSNEIIIINIKEQPGNYILKVNVKDPAVYTFDKETYKYYKVDKELYTPQDSGAIAFDKEVFGDLVISEGELVKK